MMDKRADPDAILASVKREEPRGKLTVFLGAMAGVGKTYSMLCSAREKKKEGTDLVIGWVEPHGRAETEALTEGIPCIKPKQMEYRGKFFQEMDLDGVLAEHPQLVLVDELAHTNVVGSRHARRFQDVEEILAAGIDVYTTVNIQHIESLNDVISQITGIVIRETVPDHILEEAFQVRLIDTPPEELVQRLKEGKVYISGQVEQALNKFFRIGNINAMRELALRFTAQKVERQLSTYMQAHAITGPWPVQEKIMVCVSASPFSAQLIRRARRLAGRLHTEWLAVYVETPRRLPSSEAEKKSLAKNLRLAESLGAETITVMGMDVVKEILDLAYKHNVNQVLIGKPLKSRLWEWLRGSVADRLIRESEGVTIYVITDHTLKSPTKQKAEKMEIIKKPVVISVVWILLANVILTGGAKFFEPYLGIVNINLLYLLLACYASFLGGPKKAIWSALIGVLCFDFFFVPPKHEMTISDLRYLFSFAVFLIVALSMGTIASRLRQQIKNFRNREVSTNALYRLSREIAAIDDRDLLLAGAAKRMEESMEGKVAFFLPTKTGKLEILPQGIDPVFLQENEQAVAGWVLSQGKIAGKGTDTLAGSTGAYFPLKEEGRTMGVLGVLAEEIEDHLVQAFANIIAMGLNRIAISAQAKEEEVFAVSKKLHRALFDSLSHDLRTPLASIIGSVEVLLEEEELFDAAAKRELLLNIYQGAERMHILVNNLLDMARLESGKLKLKKDWCDLQDLIGVAIKKIGGPLAKREIKIVIEPGFPLIAVDFVLMEQVLINLLENALKYSLPNSDLEIVATSFRDHVQIGISNRGKAIPEADLERIFEKFYRVKDSKNDGSGLGLTICRGIVEAHGGRIWAENKAVDEICFFFVLPLVREDSK